MLAEVGIESIR